MESQGFFEVLIWFPIGLIGIGVMMGVIKYLHLGPNQKKLVWLLYAALMTELISRYFWLQRASTFPLFHIYALIEYTLLAKVYVNLLNTKMGYYVSRSILVIWCFGVINVLLWQPLNMPNTNVTTVNSILLVAFSVFYFFKVLSEMRHQRIERSAVFWLNIGVLTYFSSSLVVFIFTNWLYDLHLNDSINVWVIHIFFNIIQYLCFNIALWMKPE